jgi:beta-lactamase regulating signal transducer with metallopeptidase domain
MARDDGPKLTSKEATVETLIRAGLANAAVAALLALAAVLVGRLMRRPRVAHVLWLLVLVKLVTPPMFTVSLPWLNGPDVEIAESELVAEVPPADAFLAPLQAVDTAPFADPVQPVAEQKPNDVAPETPTRWSWIGVAFALWLSGALVCGCVAAVRIARFHRALEHTEAAPAELRTVVRGVAARLGLRTCPEIRLVRGRIPPLVWPLGRRLQLVLPCDFLAQIDAQQTEMVVAHELAHVLRRDHLVRWLEIVVLTLQWWNPVAWFARGRLRRAEEACCDALVVERFSANRRGYAETLLRAADFVAGDCLHAPAPVSGIGTNGSLKERCEMVLRGDTTYRLGRIGWVVVAVMLIVLPVSARLSESAPAEQAKGRSLPDLGVLGTINDLKGDPSYRVQPYLRVARQLQDLDEEERTKLLREFVKTRIHDIDEQVIVVCRMLFEAKEGGAMRAPMLGAPSFLGGTTDDDWPLVPLTIFEDAPFLVVRSYAMGGRPESADKYLDYCLANCRWTTLRYKELDEAELKARLERLLKSPVWKRPLKDDEVAFLRRQLLPPPAPDAAGAKPADARPAAAKKEKPEKTGDLRKYVDKVVVLTGKLDSRQPKPGLYLVTRAETLEIVGDFSKHGEHVGKHVVVRGTVRRFPERKEGAAPPGAAPYASPPPAGAYYLEAKTLELTVVSAADIAKLKPGMAYADVEKLLGKPYLDAGRAVLRPVWVLDDGRWAWLEFDDDRFVRARVVAEGAEGKANGAAKKADGAAIPAQAPAEARDALARITRGMAEAEAAAILRAVSLDHGTLYFGGSGAKRLYYQIGPKEQVYLQIGGSTEASDFGKVTAVGLIEPKVPWTRHRGDSITLADRPLDE